MGFWMSLRKSVIMLIPLLEVRSTGDWHPTINSDHHEPESRHEQRRDKATSMIIKTKKPTSSPNKTFPQHDQSRLIRRHLNRAVVGKNMRLIPACLRAPTSQRKNTDRLRTPDRSPSFARGVRPPRHLFIRSKIYVCLFLCSINVHLLSYKIQSVFRGSRFSYIQI